MVAAPAGGAAASTPSNEAASAPTAGARRRFKIDECTGQLLCRRSLIIDRAPFPCEIHFGRPKARAPGDLDARYVRSFVVSPPHHEPRRNRTDRAVHNDPARPVRLAP